MSLFSTLRPFALATALAFVLPADSQARESSGHASDHAGAAGGRIDRTDHDHGHDHGRFEGGRFDHGRFDGRRGFYGGRYYGGRYYRGGYGYGYPYYYGPGLSFYYGGPSYAYVHRPYYGYDEGGPGDLAVDVQRSLKRRGYYPGPVDGDIGPGSRAAIRNFQADHRLSTTGRIDRDTLDALGL